MPAQTTRFAAALLLMLGLAACSATTLRHNTLSEIDIAGQPIKASWVQVPPRSIDVIIYAPSAPAAKPLTRQAAEQAAARLAGHRCPFDSVHAETPPVQFADGQFIFRYVCGSS
jgi:hypothetical protein